MSDNNRRKHQRVPLDIPCKLTWHEAHPPLPCLLIDISFGGMQLRVPTRVSLSRDVKISFTIGKGKRCQATGKIVWDGDDSFGVAFDDINDELSEFIGELMGIAEQARTVFLATVMNPELRVTSLNEQTSAAPAWLPPLPNHHARISGSRSPRIR